MKRNDKKYVEGISVTPQGALQLCSILGSILDHDVSDSAFIREHQCQSTCVCVNAFLQSGDPFVAVPAARLLALLLSYTSECLGVFHSLALQTDGLLENVLALIRTQDPVLAPACVAIIHAFACGPKSSDFCTILVRREDTIEPKKSPLIFLLRKLHSTPQHRSTAEALILALLSSRDLFDWIHIHVEVFEMFTIESGLLRQQWNMMKSLF